MNDLNLPQRLALVSSSPIPWPGSAGTNCCRRAPRRCRPAHGCPSCSAAGAPGWASMPKGSVSASVADEKELLAWAEKNYPDRVETVTEVAVDDDLIAFLAEHYPTALQESRRVRPSWVGDICAALKDPGHYITVTGEKLTEVPGIEVRENDPAPRVNLEPGAADIIAAAWRSGDVPVADLLLALPAGGGASREAPRAVLDPARVGRGCLARRRRVRSGRHCTPGGRHAR